MNPRSASVMLRLRQALLHPYALYVLLTLLVFLYSGFDIGPVNDGWIKLASYLSDSPLYGVSTTRVFGSIPRDLGMRLGGGGFVVWQLFLMVFTLLRGVLFYEIVRRLFPQSRAFAVACGFVGLFQPADAVDFWVDVTGVQMGLVTALAACLASLMYLQTGKRAALLAMLLFQLVTCFTYSGFLLLMLVFPAGVWLLRWTEGKGADWRYLLRCCWFPVAYVVFQAVLVALHFGHEGDVADLRPLRIVEGYGLETLVFLRNSGDWLGDLRWEYLPWALPTVVLAWFVVVGSGAPQQQAVHHSRRYWWVLCLGLVALAAVCYFPYAVSSVRLGGRRQLFIAAVFLYMLPLLPLFLWLPRRLKWSWLPQALVACVALISGLVGLEHRDYWAGAYRGEERLLASIATAAPQPKPGTAFVVHLQDQDQADSLGGFHNRRVAFEYALRLMYDDHDIQAAFTPLAEPLFFFEKDGLRVPQSIRVNGGMGNIPYEKLVLLDYSLDGKLEVVDRAWLQQHAPAGADLKVYAPEVRLGTAPSADSKVCVMLERSMRPSYCH